MSEEEKEIEKPNEVIDIFEKFFEFNDQTQRGQELKIFTPDQMLSRLLVTLAQLKVRNKSENVKMKSESHYFLCTGQKN